jgi:DNA-binding transcriptional ArsR family regulator
MAIPVSAPFRLFSFIAALYCGTSMMLKERNTDRSTLVALLLACVVLAAFFVLPLVKRRGMKGFQPLILMATMAEAAEIDAWKLAVQKVKEDRGEPMGKQATADVPRELAHYSDTRRFLAIQVAEWREHKFATPHDFVDLSKQIRQGELVELKLVSDNYVLFGVGGSADKEPFTYYDTNSRKRITLYNETELKREYDRISETSANLEKDLTGLRQELKTVGKKERARRTKLQSQINAKEKALETERESKESLDAYYGNAESRARLISDYEALANLAADFKGRSYDLSNARSRQEMKVRMLSFLRPEALKVLEEIAGSYHQQFDRPLPVTSLVRPDEYQHMLSKVNPNATLIETPPHSTGLAFDINYKYMTTEEQSALMNHLARLEDEGRIEVLRENRDHFHVFAFVDGARPSESLISEALGKTSVVKALKETKETKPAPKVSAREEKRASKKASTKKRKR